MAEELFRRSDSRGFYTRLLSPQGACLHSKGYSCEEPEWLLGQNHAEDDLSQDMATSEFQPLFPKNEHHDRCDPDASECMYLLFVKACWRLHRPVRSEFRLDFIEIYSGTARLSASMLEAGFSVGPPIELPEWDMGDENLFRFLVSLCRAGRISLCWLGPPCTTFSLARRPKGRSVCAPWGLDVLDYDTAVGNLHMHISLFIFACQLSCGNEAIVETPGVHSVGNFRRGKLALLKGLNCGWISAAMGPLTLSLPASCAHPRPLVLWADAVAVKCRVKDWRVR